MHIPYYCSITLTHLLPYTRERWNESGCSGDTAIKQASRAKFTPSTDYRPDIDEHSCIVALASIEYRACASLLAIDCSVVVRLNEEVANDTAVVPVRG